MPPFVVEEAQIDRLVDALDEVGDATVRFVAKNIKMIGADTVSTA